MRLADIAEVEIGTVIARVEARGKDDYIPYTAVSLDDIRSFTEGVRTDRQRLTYLISDKATDRLVIAKSDDVIFGLSSIKCLLCSKEIEGMIIPSSLCRVRPLSPEVVDPAFLCYLLNDDPSIRKNIEVSHQQSTNRSVKTILASTLRELDIGTLPPIDEQRIMGKLYLSLLRRKGLEKEISEKEMNACLLMMNMKKHN